MDLAGCRGLSASRFGHRMLVGGPRVFDLGGGAHRERGVSASGVVPELDVVVDRRRELDPGLPAAAVEQLDLQAAPEALHHRVVERGADGPHRWGDPGVADVLAEGP